MARQNREPRSRTSTRISRRQIRQSENESDRLSSEDQKTSIFPIAIGSIAVVVIGGMIALSSYYPNLLASALNPSEESSPEPTTPIPSPTASPIITATPTSSASPTPSPTATPSPTKSPEESFPKVPDSPKAIQPAQMYQKLRPAVVFIYSGLSQGSGVIADPNGMIITNEHVVRGQTHVTVKTTWGKTYDGLVTVVNADVDLAVVKIQSDRALACIPFETSPVEIGQTVYALGNPLGMESTFTNGMVSRIDGKGDILHTTAIAPGSSGSPLLNEYGKAIAINKAVRRDIAISISTPAAALASLVTQPVCP